MCKPVLYPEDAAYIIYRGNSFEGNSKGLKTSIFLTFHTSDIGVWDVQAKEHFILLLSYFYPKIIISLHIVLDYILYL